MTTILDVLGVGMTYPGTGVTHALPVLDGVDFKIPKGAIVSLVGLNGSGKSTLLRIIAGLEQASSGRIFLQGKQLPPRPDERIGMMFQEETLLPWLTAVENIEIGLEIKGVSKRERRQRTLDYLAMFGLSDSAHKYPRELSGGMRQKVTIARTLIPEPQLVLMDEPFSALDCETRHSLQRHLLHIWAKRRDSILFVTHNIEEALMLSDAVVIMTPKPSTVSEVIPVDLPRPRNRLDVRFNELRQHILDLLKVMSKTCRQRC